jgi:hypothetical protein
VKAADVTEQPLATQALVVKSDEPPVEEPAPQPPHTLPRVSLPEDALAFMKQRLEAGDFSLVTHGRQLYDLLMPYTRPRPCGGRVRSAKRND